MTRDEAIEMLKNTIAYESNFAEAKRMAIEALKGGDAEVNETKSPYMQHSPIIGADLISRADATRAVAEHFSFDDGCSNIYKDISYYIGIAEHILKNVPSALPSADTVSREAWNDVTEEYVNTVGAILAVISAPSCLKEVNDMVSNINTFGERKNDSE